MKQSMLDMPVSTLLIGVFLKRPVPTKRRQWEEPAASPIQGL